VFAGKTLAALTYAFVALAVYVIVALAAGGIAFGFHPVTSLSGTPVSVGHGFVLIGAGSLAYFLPVMAVASIALLLSTVTRNSAASFGGTLMFSLILQVLGVISSLDFLHPYLLSTEFNAWQGLLRDPIDWAPIVRGAWVSAAYGIPSLAIAFVVFLRRDVAGG
jgi:ABC-2 type transport system permease protein